MNVTVYCGATTGNDPVYASDAVALGQWIAENNHTLVYGGGKAGLMGIVADTVLNLGGKAIGVIPTFLKDRELAHTELDELIVVNTMSERKDKMFALGDIYIALPGGAGTLEEITDVISWSRIGQNNNPCVFFSTNNYYDFAAKMYDKMVEADFLSQDDREKILFSNSIEEIEKFIETYVPPQIRLY